MHEITLRFRAKREAARIEREKWQLNLQQVIERFEGQGIAEFNPFLPNQILEQYYDLIDMESDVASLRRDDPLLRNDLSFDPKSPIIALKLLRELYVPFVMAAQQAGIQYDAVDTRWVQLEKAIRTISFHTEERFVQLMTNSIADYPYHHSLGWAAFSDAQDTMERLALIIAAHRQTHDLPVKQTLAAHNDDRDEFIWKSRVAGRTYKWIRDEILNRPEWFNLDHESSVLAALKRYCQRKQVAFPT